MESKWIAVLVLMLSVFTASQTTDGCAITLNQDCPWCVKLFNEAQRLICLGAIISSSVILTAATCLQYVKDERMFVQVPTSAKPDVFYEVRYRQTHDSYNSGTHAFDFALLTVDPVEWGPSGTNGACYKDDILAGDCVGAGLDANDDIVMSSLSVNSGHCHKTTNVADASCGEQDGSNCNVVTGAPIMCSVNNGIYVLLGVARAPCRNGKTQLGSLEQSKEWLINTLKGTMSLRDKEFLYSENYD